MDDRTKQFVDQLRSNPAALQGLMQSRDGQELLRMLTAGDRGAALQQAAQSAARGNPAEIANLVSRVMQSPEGAQLLTRINKAIQK
ncbi:MAG: hypothetical protein RR350_04655 [Oscillibacter sp.]